MDSKQSFSAYVKEFVNLPFGALPPEQFHAEYLRLVEADIAEAQKHLPELPESERRGLTLETYRHFHCGYLPQWTLTKCRAEYHCGTYVDESGKPKRLPPASERIIIPTSNKHFNAVATPRARRDGLKKNFWKQHANEMELFCDPTALSADVIVVVEGEIDAMSIWQATNGEISPVAILGCSNFAKTLGVHMAKLRNKKFILLLDADAAGKKSAEKLCAQLIQEKYSVVCRYLYDFMPPEFKKHPENIHIDANGILTSYDYGTAALRRCIEKVIGSATNALNALAEKFSKERAELDALPTAEFSPDLSKMKSARQSGNSASTPAISKNFSGSNVTADISDADRDLVLDILDKVHARDLTRDEWFKFGCVLKLYNFPYEVFDSWSNDGDPRYNSEICRQQWNSFGTADSLNNSCARIGTMIQIAKERGYEMNHSKHPAQIVTTGDKDLDAEINSELISWQESHENAPIAPKNVQNICKAVVAVGAVTKKDVSANLVSNFMIRNVALLEYYLPSRAEKFYDLLREANVTGYSKTDYQARTKSVKEIIRKAQNEFTREENNRIAAEDNRRRRQARDEQVKTNEDRLKELWTQPQSAERDAEIISLIRDSCVWKYDKNGNPIEIKSNGRNADLIFKYDPVIVGLFGKDYFRDNVAFLRKPNWRTIEQHTKTWNDDDDSQLRNYLRLTYDDFGNELLVTDNIVVTAAKNAFHEVKDYFKSLPKWDGVKRAETYFIDVLKVDDTPFVREVTLNWLTAAVARIYRPGCRYHYCLIIHGAQGIGKSFSFESLGKNWYQVLEAEVTDPHAIDALETTWIGEFAEFKGMRKADVNATKAFVSTSADNRRRAYAHHTVSVPRHCVLCATVNDSEFLSDATGNRRFPIFESRLKAYEHGKEITDEYINQIWAEVYLRYMEQFHNLNDLELGHALQLSTAAQAIVEGTAEKFIRDDGLKLEIESLLDIPILPDVIWKLMSKEERSKFIAEKSIVFDDATLCRRRRGLGGRPADIDRDVDAIRKAELNQDFVVDFKTLDGNNGANYHRFYGYIKREHICAAEIFNEFSSRIDRRLSMRRIGEVLQQIDGWHDGGRYQNQDPEYKDQRKCYWRNSADNNNNNTQNNNQDTDKNNTQEEVLQNENSTDTDKTVSHGIKLRNYDAVIIPNDEKSFEPFDGVPVDPDNLPF